MPTGGTSKTRRGVMPGTRNRNVARNSQKTTFRCGHRGLGAFCHRCEQAKVLTANAEKGVIVIYDRKTKPKKPVVQKATTEDVRAMRAEAARLLKPAANKT